MQHKPKVIIIKSGMYWSPILSREVPIEIAISGVNQPLNALINLAKNRGYTPVCYTGSVIFVRNDLVLPFNEIVKDPVTLWMDAWRYFLERHPTYISWIIKNRGSSGYIQRFDTHPLPEYITH